MKKLYPIGLFKSQLNPNAVMICCNIFSNSSEYKLCTDQIIRETGISRNYVFKHLAYLKKLNIIKVVSYPGCASSYSLNPESEWKLDCQENKKIDENIINDGTPVPVLGTTLPVPVSGTTPVPVSGTTPVPVSGTRNIGKNIEKTEYISACCKNTHEKSIDLVGTAIKPDVKNMPKKTSKGYTRCAQLFLSVTDSHGWHRDKAKGWAMALVKEYGAPQIERNIQKLFETGIASKTVMKKPNFNLFVAIASGKIFEN